MGVPYKYPPTNYNRLLPRPTCQVVLLYFNSYATLTTYRSPITPNMSRVSSSLAAPNVIFPPPQADQAGQTVDPYAKLSLPTASQAQICEWLCWGTALTASEIIPTGLITSSKASRPSIGTHPVYGW